MITEVRVMKDSMAPLRSDRLAEEGDRLTCQSGPVWWLQATVCLARPLQQTSRLAGRVIGPDRAVEPMLMRMD
jgi:hypothetical protein